MILFWLQIIRFNNLILLILLLSALYRRFYGDFISIQNFIFVVFLTAVIAGFGNMVNDYFDIDNDVRNEREKPLSRSADKKPLVRKILYSSGIFIHLTLFVLFFNKPAFIYICLCSFWLLFFYSYPFFLHFKSIPLLGNIIIASLSAISLLILTVFSGILVQEVLFWALSAFFLSVSREILKDAEDLTGDKASGIKTLASVCGMGVSRFFSLIFTLFLFPVIFWGLEKGLINIQAAVFASIFTAFLLIFISFAKEKKDFSRLSFAHKLLMFASLLMIL